MAYSISSFVACELRSAPPCLLAAEVGQKSIDDCKQGSKADGVGVRREARAQEGTDRDRGRADKTPCKLVGRKYEIAISTQLFVGP
jgi:hypothetical protein